jgi:hypothetical protein
MTMADNTIKSLTEFQASPELQKEFGGNYLLYLSSFEQQLSNKAVFDFAGQGYSTVPGLNKVSLFYNVNRTDSSQQADEEKQKKIEEKLNKITNPKIKAQVEAEFYTGNLSDAFMDLLIAKHEQKMAEFDEIWAKYQMAKAQRADLKKTCERLLVEYQNSNDSSVKKGQYNNAYREYSEADLDADIYLSIARDISHRVV